MPGSAQDTYLVVDDIDAARAELVGHGAGRERRVPFRRLTFFTSPGRDGRLPGPDPKRSSYFSFASFSDPDGNSWLLQEVKTRFPGRGLSSDVATLTELLREAEERHGEYEAAAPIASLVGAGTAGYLVARQRGKTPDEASAQAARQLERTAERVQA